jgi:hypothetical protein
LTARLDQGAPSGPPGAGAPRSHGLDEPDDDLEVPEFIPPE